MGDKYVITSAHCTEGENPSNVFVRLGDTSLDEEFEATSLTLGVANIIQHPGFDYTLEYLEYGLAATNENVIAVLVLNDTVSLTEYPNIKPACLPEAGALFPGTATATGWGSAFAYTEYTEVVWVTASLNEVDMTVLDDEDCEELNFDEFNTLYLDMGDDMICAGSRDSSNGRLVFLFTFLRYFKLTSSFKA